MTFPRSIIRAGCHSQREIGGAFLVGLVLACMGNMQIAQADTPKPITFNPQILITTDNISGVYIPFYLWWSTSGDASWPNYVYADSYDAGGNEIWEYPQEDPNVYSIPADHVDPTSPPANWVTNPTGREPVPAPPPWSMNQFYNVGDKVQPTAAHANGHTYVCTTAGQSAGSEPAWNPGTGLTTSESAGPVTWQEKTSPLSVLVAVSGQWSADSGSPTTAFAATRQKKSANPPPFGVDYALQKRSVAGQPRKFDVWFEIQNGTSTPREMRFVYALFRKTDPDNGQLIPIPVNDSSGYPHIFRRLKHAGSTRYVVSKTQRDYPYIVKDLRVDLSSISPTDYVYLDVFVVDLVNVNGWAMKRIQIQP
jgi:hypothetical protein